MLEPGSQVQNAIYLAGGAEWPVSPEEWETRARETLQQGPFDYVAGGAGSESTIRANREAFERRRLRPRMLVGTAERDLSVEVLGLRSPAPFLLAPVGVLSILHQEAELGVARASKATGVPMILSSAASTALEDVATELGDAQRWFQLYWWSDRELAGSLVDRAAAAGYGAIVVTLDTLTLGWRERDLGNGYLPILGGEGLGQFFSDPIFRARLDAAPEEDVQTASLMALAAFPNLALTWADLGWLRARTDLPIWWAEITPVPFGSSDRYPPGTEAALWAQTVETLRSSGAAVALLWQGESSRGHTGLWTSAETADGGRPTAVHDAVAPSLR